MSVLGPDRYLARLDARIRAVGSCLCLGLDPDPAALPAGFSPDVEGIERFARLVLEAALPYAAAVKPNLAFFEAFGSAGLQALERLRSGIPADVPVIADAKRGDIGSTAVRQAVALFDVLGADAVTASPYLGAEAIAPLLERSDRFVYVLCRTSNPGAAEFQGLEVGADPVLGRPAEPLYRRVAARAVTWHERYGTIGLVVGATAPLELAEIRQAAPSLAFLVPGVGAQGGDAAAVLAAGPAREGQGATVAGGGLLVNVSRAIAAAAIGAADPVEAVAAAARDWSARLAVLR
ncbi:MAG: orotidine-5'-phosphate decarboxylase [Candidatus Limnocylindrales bacterium]